MSGWWLLSREGDVEHVRPVHLHHVVEQRPDIVKFLALEQGYAFINEPERVWKES
jgi:hypothetical protein